MFTEEQWNKELREYCKKLNIETTDLPKILNDPKVAPMVRGKAFEYSVSYRLKNFLSFNDWIVSKPKVNAQEGSDDIDVKVIHQKTGLVINIECKLTKKGGFTVVKRPITNREKGDYIIPVKCMRSRTTKTPEKVQARAKKLGISDAAFLAHSDQYRASNFDIVITSIGNAFYITNEQEGTYQFSPPPEAQTFLRRFNFSNTEDLQAFIYNKVYVAKSADLAVSQQSGVTCSKEACPDKKNCGFIPNYPLINFGNIDLLPIDQVPKPKNCWVELEDSLPLLESIIDSKRKA